MCAFVDNISVWLTCNLSALSQNWNTSSTMEHSLPLAWLNKKRKIDGGLKVIPLLSLAAEFLLCSRMPKFCWEHFMAYLKGYWSAEEGRLLLCHQSFHQVRPRFLKQNRWDKPEYHPKFYLIEICLGSKFVRLYVKCVYIVWSMGAGINMVVEYGYVGWPSLFVRREGQPTFWYKIP